MSGLYLETVPGARVPNVDSIALAILELLAFNVQKFMLSAEEGMEVYLKNIFKGWVHVKRINIC